jgi:hypothetical protein
MLRIGSGTGCALKSMRALMAAGAVLAAGASLAQPTPGTHWDAAYDPATRTRFIPPELIVGGDWDGNRALVLPMGRFIESVSRGPSTWIGPAQWVHRETGENLAVYERRRRGVIQKMAVRKDGSAIGRVEDSRNDSTCDQEGKFPLGPWQQGETRRFEYSCWTGPAGARRSRTYVATITIEDIDFAFSGAEHSLRIRWTYKRKDEDRELDHKIYVFSPGLSMVSIQ